MEEQLPGEIKNTDNELYSRFIETISVIEKKIQYEGLVVSDLAKFNDLTKSLCRNLAKFGTLSEVVGLHEKVRQLFEKVADYCAEEYQGINRILTIDRQEPEEARAQMAVVDPLMLCMINMHHVMASYLPLALKDKETDTRNILQVEYLSRIKDKYHNLIESSIKALTNPTGDLGIFIPESMVDDDFWEEKLPHDQKKIPGSAPADTDLNFLTQEEQLAWAISNSLSDSRPATLNSTVEEPLPTFVPLKDPLPPLTVFSSQHLGLSSSSSEQPSSQENKEVTFPPRTLEPTISQSKKRKTPGKDDLPPQIHTTPKRPKPSLTDQLTTLLLEFESRMELKDKTNFDLAADCKLVSADLQKQLKERQSALLAASRTGSVPGETALNWASAMHDFLRLRVALGYLLNYPKNKTAIVNPSLTETLLTLDFFIKKLLMQANPLAQFAKNSSVPDERLASESSSISKFPNLLLRNLLGRYLAFKRSCDNISKITGDKANYLCACERSIREGEMLNSILENPFKNSNSEFQTVIHVLLKDVTSSLNKLKKTMEASSNSRSSPALALNPSRFKYIKPDSDLTWTEGQEFLLPDPSEFSSSKGEKEGEMVPPIYST